MGYFCLGTPVIITTPKGNDYRFKIRNVDLNKTNDGKIVEYYLGDSKRYGDTFLTYNSEKGRFYVWSYESIDSKLVSVKEELE